MSESAKKGTVKAILIMMFSMLMSRGLGFIRTAVLAGQAGTNGGADAYAFSFLLPDLLNQMLAGGALSVTFIPLFQSLDHDKEEQNRFFSNLFWIGSLIFFIGVLISYAITPLLITKLAGDAISTGETLNVTVKLTRIILPAQLFFFWGAILNGVQYANKKFFIPSMTPVMYNLGIIAGGVFLYRVLGIEGFSWGVLVGAFVGNVLLPTVAVQKLDLSLKFHIDPKQSELREWFFKTFPLIFTIGLANANEMMLRLFGSHIADGSGTVSALTYAYRTYMILVGLFGQAFASAIYPFISKIASDNSRPLEERYREMEETLFSTLKKTAVFTLVIPAIMFVLRNDIIALLYERGAFSADSTALTAQAFAAYLPGMFFFSGALILMRLFFSLKQTYTTLLISLISLGISVPLYRIGIEFGVVGVGLAGSCAAVITFSLLLFRWKQIHKESRALTLMRQISVVFAGAVAAGTLAWGIGFLPLPDGSQWYFRIARMTIQGILPMEGALLLFDRLGYFNLRSLLKRGRK